MAVGFLRGVRFGMRPAIVREAPNTQADSRPENVLGGGLVSPCYSLAVARLNAREDLFPMDGTLFGD